MLEFRAYFSSSSRDYLVYAFYLFPGELCMIMTKGSVEFFAWVVFDSSNRLPLGVSYFFLALLVRTIMGNFDGEFQKWEFFFFYFCFFFDGKVR